MKKSIIIEGELPNLNNDIAIIRSHIMAYAKHKEEWTEYCMVYAMEKRIKVPMELFPITPTFYWFTKNEKVDCDNIAFAKKYILDGLVAARVIPNDSRKFIKGFGGDIFEVDTLHPRVEIKLF